MVRPTLRIDVSPHAKIAMEDIYGYTAEHWGIAQAKKYYDQWDAAFTALARNPHLGHDHSGVPLNYFVYPVSRHFVIYRTDRATLYIVAILHQSMDIDDRMERILKTINSH